MSKSAKIALCGVISALAVVLMMLTGLIPIGTFALPALAGILSCIIVIECSLKHGLGIFVSVSLLSFFLAPDKEAVLYYIAFFGYYPILKNIIERIKSKILRIVLKLSSFNIAMVCCYYASMHILMIPEDSFTLYGVNLPQVFLLVGNFVFLLYDYSLSMMISAYVIKFRKKLLKNFKR